MTQPESVVHRKKLGKKRLWSVSLLGFFLFLSSFARADEVVVVLSSNLRPYQETLAGLQASLGRPVSIIDGSIGNPVIPFGTRVIVAIGGKAALQNYPSEIPFVYCLSPGILLPANDRKAPVSKIYMTPPAHVVMDQILQLQPQLGSLGILGLSESRDEFNEIMEQSGASRGVKVYIEKMTKPDELPDRLRELQSRVKAIWIPPDPRLITAQNFKLIKEFCLSKHIAFYVPTVELVEQGATASVASSFDDIGRAAGDKAKELLSGNNKGGKVYPEVPRVAINQRAAAEIGLKLSPEQLQKAYKLIP
jgi:ABC-type uncharacterized transport system substrate-binding protein